MPIALCCSFAPLSFDYDYSGLASFMPFVDYCVFLDNGLSKKSINSINNFCKEKGVHWFTHTFSNFSDMRNRLIKLSIKIGKTLPGKDDTYCLMIDDCYSLEGTGVLYPCDQLRFNYEIEDYDGSTYQSKYIKLFKANTHKYVLQTHEVLVGPPGVEAEDTTLTLRDLPDKKRTTDRAREDIKMLKQDLYEYGADNFLRDHIYRYLCNSHMLLGEEDEAIKCVELSLKNICSPMENYQ